jgi:ferritin-like metal-binding protein YciE
MSKMATLHDLFIHEVKDLYSAEIQLIKALPGMAAAAATEALKAGFKEHLAETREHVARLERIGRLLDFSPKGRRCLAMEGIVAEGREVIAGEAAPSVKDAALICAAQKVEHYEIAGYGALLAFAELLGYDEPRRLIGATLREVRAVDSRLSHIAASVNQAAEHADDGR